MASNASSIQPSEAASRVRRCATVVWEKVAGVVDIREIVRSGGEGGKGKYPPQAFHPSDLVMVACRSRFSRVRAKPKSLAGYNCGIPPSRGIRKVGAPSHRTNTFFLT